MSCNVARLVELVDQADTRGLDRHELVAALGITDDEAQALAREVVDAGSVYAIDRRLYSTRPFDETTT